MEARYWVGIFVAAAGWGSGGIATRAAFDEGVDVWTLVASRTAMAAVLVLIVLVAQRTPLPSLRILGFGLVQAVFNFIIPISLFTFAYAEASAGFVGLLAALIPLTTAIFARFMLPDEPLTAAKLIALFIGFSGVAALLLSGDSGLAEGGRPLLAVGLGLASVASIGFAGTFAKKTAGAYSPIVLTGIQFTISAVVLVTVMLAVEGAPRDVTPTGWALIAFMAIAATAVPFLLFFWLMQYISATEGSLIGYIVPFVALVGGIVILGEELQAGIIVGGLLVFTGMVLTDRAGRKANAGHDIHSRGPV